MTYKVTFSVIFYVYLFGVNAQLTIGVDTTNGPNPQSVSEHPGGIIRDGTQVFYKSKSPYWIRNDIIVEKNAELVLEPGVQLRFEPMVGITVRGILTAQVRKYCNFHKIKFINCAYYL